MANSSPDNPQGKKKFLGIHFLGCNTYGRMYPNKDNTYYVGRCPRCGLSLKVKIGANGTSDRFFRSQCLMNRIGAAQPR